MCCLPFSIKRCFSCFFRRDTLHTMSRQSGFGRCQGLCRLAPCLSVPVRSALVGCSFTVPEDTDTAFSLCSLFLRVIISRARPAFIRQIRNLSNTDAAENFPPAAELTQHSAVFLFRIDCNTLLSAQYPDSRSGRRFIRLRPLLLFRIHSGHGSISRAVNPRLSALLFFPFRGKRPSARSLSARGPKNSRITAGPRRNPET